MTAATDAPRLRSSGAVAPQTGEPLAASVARSLVHGVTAAVFAWPLTVSSAVAAAAVGGVLGAAAGRLLAGSRARLWTIVAGAVAFLGLAVVVHGALGRGALPTDALGPAGALRAAEAFAFGAGVFAVSAALRAASARAPLFGGLEVAAVALSFAQLVVAHRHGAINRPFDIADPILARGDDPATAMVAIGVVAAGVMVLHLLAERRPLRALAHLALAALLLGLVVVGIEPPKPDASQLLAAGGEGKRQEEARRRRRGGGEGGEGERDGRRSPDNEMPFDAPEQEPTRTPVAVVLFHDEYSPPSGTYYFRQTAFSQFNGVRLVAATGAGVDEDVARAFPVGPTPVRAEPPGPPDRTVVETTVALLAEHPRPFGLEAPAAFEPAPNPNPARFRRLYAVRSRAIDVFVDDLVGYDAGDPDWDDEAWAHYTALPDDPRYAALADRILESLLPEELRGEPAARAFAISHWLGKRGTYSLKSGHADAGDPTAHFLFGDLTGYCVHFAHAAAYLMRAAGLPARVATGYAVPEANRRGGSALVLTSAEAHAWPEVFLDGAGWVVVDVAVENVLDPAPAPPDPDLQRLLGELARGEEPLPVDGESRTPWIVLAREALGAAGRLAVALAVLALALLVVGKAWRRLAPAFAPAPAQPRVAYRAVLDALADVALVRRWGESREAFARRLADVAPSLGPLTDAHLDARFGPGARLDPRDLASRVRRELRAAVPRWRRWAGLLVPWTWLRVR